MAHGQCSISTATPNLGPFILQRRGTFRLLLHVEGKLFAQQAEDGRPVLRVTAGGVTRVYGWNGMTFAQR